MIYLYEYLFSSMRISPLCYSKSPQWHMISTLNSSYLNEIFGSPVAAVCLSGGLYVRQFIMYMMPFINHVLITHMNLKETITSKYTYKQYGALPIMQLMVQL
jgi:hypothetical protein